MGCAPSDGACHPDEYPAHQVTLAGFELDRVEVTQAAYAKCVQTHKCTALASGPVAASPSLPVTGVSFAQAQAYCAFRGKRLPTEAEWEKAARGTDERVYPWGTHVPDCAIANWSLCGGQSRAAAGLAGASPYGAADLAGNVWEWVADFYAPDYYDQSPAADPQGPASGGTRVIRGGSFQTGPDLLRASARAWVDPSATYDSVGFRCARSI